MTVEDERIEAFKFLHQNQPVHVEMPIEHPLYEEVQNVVKKHLIYCDPTAQELRTEEGWQIIAEEGEMRIYKKEVENDEGIVLDPLQVSLTCGIFFINHNFLSNSFIIFCDICHFTVSNLSGM